MPRGCEQKLLKFQKFGNKKKPKKIPKNKKKQTKKYMYMCVL